MSRHSRGHSLRPRCSAQVPESAASRGVHPMFGNFDQLQRGSWVMFQAPSTVLEVDLKGLSTS